MFVSTNLIDCFSRYISSRGSNIQQQKAMVMFVFTNLINRFCRVDHVSLYHEIRARRLQTVQTEKTT